MIAIRWPAITILSLVTALFALQADDQFPSIIMDEPQVVTLNEEMPVQLAYESPGDEVVTLTVRNLEEESIDTVLEVLYPEGERLAYNDDHMHDLPALAQTDSALVDLVLPVAGTYIIRVNSYGNIAVGEVEVLVTDSDPFRATILNPENGDLIVSAYLPRWETFEYQFDVDAADQLTITARDTSGTLDLQVTLRDDSGAIMAENDDHNSNNLTLNVFDVQIDGYVVEEAGGLQVQVQDFTGNPGRFTLRISRESR